MIPSTPQLLIVVVAIFLLFVLPYLVFSPIARKAGFSKWWSLTMILPFVNIAVIWMFAFAEWPSEKNNEA